MSTILKHVWRRKILGKRRLPLKTVVVSARVTEPVLKEIDRIVWAEGYTDASDYLRNLIRKDFKERGVRVKMEEKTST
ncbi:MAG: ribbon-helix-helix domain-containing protein [Candidatus Bathyarchaeota archaeon]|nr:ribbon-helix-helix domain-containing protein [Candidatus Bathyarchaeota archaeon]